MKDNLLNEARSISIYEILSYYGIEFYKNSCKCIFHEDNNRSAYVSNSNRFHCKSCGAKGLSNVDIVTHFEGITDIRESAKRVLELKGTSVNTIKYFDNNNKPIKEKKQLTFQDRKNLAENKNMDILVKYLNSRGISKDILPILKANNITYGADKLNQVHFFFNRHNYCIYRSIKQDKNFNCGNSTPICVKSNNTNKWYIVEGLYDGLSLLQFNSNVIILNSISNKDKFLEKFKTNKNMFNFKYIIATDNDKPGLDTKAELENFFKNNNVDYEIFENLYNSKYKDVNDLIKGGFNESKTTLI